MYVSPFYTRAPFAAEIEMAVLFLACFYLSWRSIAASVHVVRFNMSTFGMCDNFGLDVYHMSYLRDTLLRISDVTCNHRPVQYGRVVGA